jgi:hypothetical protein
MSVATIALADVQPWKPCIVTFNSVDLGATYGAVEIVQEVSFLEKKVAQYGDLVLDKVFNGELWMVRMTLAENDYSNRVVTFPQATASGGTTVNFGKIPGQSMLAAAQALNLHPQGVTSSDTSDDWDFYKAVVHSKEAISLQAGDDQANALIFEFLCLPNLALTDGYLIGKYGG